MSFKLTSIAIATLLVANVATAQTATPKAPEPNYTISYNLGVTSDYRYRGISQTTLRPALQGGLDYAHKNGVYLGAWASTIKWIRDDGKVANVDSGSSPVELDLYGGYKFEVAKDLTLDFGALQYVYTGNKYSSIPGATNANTLEFYGAATYGVFTAKYYRSQGPLFGVGAASGGTSSKGSGYLDLSATFDLGNGYSLVPHLGKQTVTNNNNLAYADYSLTVNKDIDGLVLSGAFVTANTKNIGAYTYATPESQNRGKGAIVLSVKKNF